MDSKWAAQQLKERNPVRRKSWALGEFAGNDGSLFWRCADPKTYNSPHVTTHFYFTLDDVLADDWEPVQILERHNG